MNLCAGAGYMRPEPPKQVRGDVRRRQGVRGVGAVLGGTFEQQEAAAAAGGERQDGSLKRKAVEAKKAHADGRTLQRNYNDRELEWTDRD